MLHQGLWCDIRVHVDSAGPNVTKTKTKQEDLTSHQRTSRHTGGIVVTPEDLTSRHIGPDVRPEINKGKLLYT